MANESHVHAASTSDSKIKRNAFVYVRVSGERDAEGVIIEKFPRRKEALRWIA